MTAFRDSVLASMPDIAIDEPNALADAICELLYTFDMQLPMADQLRAINRYQELLND